MAGTTNLLQWNPTAANQENDAAYAADSQRAGGATDPSVFQSILANKAFFQWSTYLTALFSAFAAKGFTTSDSNINTLTAQCANFLTTADVRPLQVTVAYSPTPAFDATAASIRFQLNGNVTSSTIASAPAGTKVTFFIVSASPGAYSFVWPSNVLYARNVQTESEGNLFTQEFITDGVNYYPTETALGVIDAAAAAAQNTANTALTNAATAQTTANNALAKIIDVVMNVVTGSRNFGSTFTNTSGGPMTVSVIMFRGSGSGDTRLDATVNGNEIASNTTTSTISGATLGVTFIVPTGGTYSVVASGLSGSPSFSLQQWTEWVYA